MALYLDNGYLNIEWIRQRGMAFNFICGGRATGKTYGALTNMLDTSSRFMFMRRTQTQIDEVKVDELSPFKKINADRKINIGCKPVTKQTNAFYNMALTDDDKLVASGATIGYTCALSTISNLRGFDASDVDVLIFDEFIPERHDRPIRHEAQAFMNAYETINRNRELQGQKPVQVLALTNANDLACPIFMEWGLVSVIENMKKKGLEFLILPDRSIGIYLLDNSAISKAKADTVLYRAGAGSTFTDMSLGNDFIENDMTNIKSMNLSSYDPFVKVGELMIYRHKSKYEYYVCSHISGKPKEYGTSETERARFKKAYLWLWSSYIDGRVYFEEYYHKALFEKYFLQNYGTM